MDLIQQEIIANWEQNKTVLKQKKSEIEKYRIQLANARYQLLEHMYQVKKGDILTDDNGKTWKFKMINKWTSHDKTPELNGFELAANGLEVSGKLKAIGEGWEK